VTNVLWLLLLPAVVGAATGAGVGVLAGVFEDGGLAWLNRAPGATAAFVSLLALPATFAVARATGLLGKTSGAELYIHTYHEGGGRLPLREIPARILAAIATVGLGGSQGFEAASALLGSSLGDATSRWRRLAPPADFARSLATAGASAGIAAVFSSPAVGLLYGLEVPFRRDLDAPRLVPAAIASACSYAARVAVSGAHPLIEVRELPSLEPLFVAGCLAIGVVCGFGGRAFAWSQTQLQHLARRNHPLLRVALASLLFGLLAWAGHALAGTWISLGPGHIAADWLLGSAGAVPGHAALLLVAVLLVRTAGTLICVYGGGGGVFTALALTGAFLGELVGLALGRGGGTVFPFVGAACFLSAGYRLPLSCMLWVGEASGDVVLTLGGTVAIAVTQVCVGEWSVSEAKREMR